MLTWREALVAPHIRDMVADEIEGRPHATAQEVADAVMALLGQLTDLYEEGTRVSEWRVVYDRPPHPSGFTSDAVIVWDTDFHHRDQAHDAAARSAHVWPDRNARVQTRTVTTWIDGTTVTTPWKDEAE